MRSLDEVMTAVMTSRIPLDDGPWKEASPQCLDLIRRLLTRDPTQRLTAVQAMQHEWFRMHVPQSDGALQNNIVPTDASLNSRSGSLRSVPGMLAGARSALAAL
jgi:calcium-dependent protein kinase